MNFALIMLIALVVTGAIWLYDRFVGSRRRAEGIKEPVVVEYAKSFFPVILVVFLLRSFLVEPFKIPSGSMMPTLLIGDFILVNKYDYGIRLPVIDRKIIDIGTPHRGDVVVFRYPNNPSVDYIKRLVGLPGDTVTYRNKHLFINGKSVKWAKVGRYHYVKSGLNYVNDTLYREHLGTHNHQLLVQPDSPSVRLEDIGLSFPHRGNCQYNTNGFTCIVPPGNYFMMGDNRDDSNDSRYWGFVPDRNLVGKAFLVWWNFSDLKRMGTWIR